MIEECQLLNADATSAGDVVANVRAYDVKVLLHHLCLVRLAVMRSTGKERKRKGERIDGQLEQGSTGVSVP